MAKSIEKRGGQRTPSELKTIVIPELDLGRLAIEITGDHIVVQRPGEHTMEKIEAKQSGRPETGGKTKEPRNPQLEYEQALYHTPDGEAGGPAKQIKDGLLFVAPDAGVTKAKVFRGIQLEQSVIPISGIGPRMRSDLVKRQGQLQMAYRPEWVKWTAVVRLTYDKSTFPGDLGIAQVVNLLKRAGFSYGWGEGRPGSPKSPMPGWGLYTIKDVHVEEINGGSSDAPMEGWHSDETPG